MVKTNTINPHSNIKIFRCIVLKKKHKENTQSCDWIAIYYAPLTDVMTAGALGFG
jgi:hypothetical protein